LPWRTQFERVNAVRLVFAVRLIFGASGAHARTSGQAQFVTLRVVTDEPIDSAGHDTVLEFTRAHPYEFSFDQLTPADIAHCE